MKCINKQCEPQKFATWRRKNQKASWGDFSKTVEYREVKSQMIKEQDGLCCYCEIAIPGDVGSHVEHYKPKSGYPSETFNYQNLLACCEQTDSCGHKKGGSYFDGLISPLSATCQDRFTYTHLGLIIPKDENDADAINTIKLLCLNCARLQDRRKTIIQMLSDLPDCWILESINSYRDWYRGFCTVIQYIARKRNII